MSFKEFLDKVVFPPFGKKKTSLGYNIVLGVLIVGFFQIVPLEQAAAWLDEHIWIVFVLLPLGVRNFVCMCRFYFFS